MPQQPAGAPADLDTISAAMKRYNLNHSEVVSLQDVCTDCERLRLEGKELIAARRYIEATRVFREAICIIMGKDFGVPGWSKNHGMVMERYTKITDWQRVALMKCCNGIVQCRAMLDDMQGVLDWAEEVEILYKHAYFTTDVTLAWKLYTLDSEEFSTERIFSYVLASEVFLRLGNSGAAAHRRSSAQSVIGDMDHYDTTTAKKLVNTSRLFEMLKLRHPDPSLVQKIEIEDACLQVRESWKKVPWPKSGRLRAGSRLGFSSFIWKSHLYIAGGIRNQHLTEKHHYRDLFCLDLEKLDEWRELPPYPVSATISGLFLGWTMVVHKSKAYLFTGRPQLDFFDLLTEKWGSVMTRTKSDQSWPYEGYSLIDYTMQLVDGKLFVFGGSHFGSQVGCNVLMTLDLEALEWQHLSGTSKPQADYSCPGPRIHSTSWIVGDRLFIMYGMANRQAAKLHNQLHGADIDYPFDDMWSWSIPQKKWRNERLLGNPPCPRCESACVYNSKLNETIVFGGYSPCLMTDMGLNGHFNFSYYADTFIFNHVTSSWKQVLTRGFPTYRAQSHLLSDPSTGKTFLVGGYTNMDYVPSRKKFISRSFDDLWQLCIDEPGGYFVAGDFEKDKKTAQAGPWQRCFACSSVGQWRKCGGTCQGRAFFCDAQCLKDGWKEHKTNDGCRKA